MKVTSTIIAIFIMAILPVLSYAHGGRLAADGCHNDTKAGTRHCHRPSSPPSNPPSSSSCNSTSTGSCGNSQYDRNEWGYTGISFSTNVGYYSGQACSSVDADHVVSLKDSHDSGGCAWSSAQKSQFANDPENLVPSCSSINRSKGAALPAAFIRRAGDGSGVDFVFTSTNICNYLAKYKQVKDKYGLSLDQNDPVVFGMCGISL